MASLLTNNKATAIKKSDFLIIGGGIVGLALARELAKRGLGRVRILEKEKKLGVHSSGRNSGVLHAGIYYPPDSLKAKVCVAGQKRMLEYALEHDIPVKKTGKVIVATEPGNVSQLDVLFERARANGVRVEKIDLNHLKEIEPEAHSFEKALYSPDTAVIDAKKVLECLSEDLAGLGVTLEKDAEAVSIDTRAKTVRGPAGTYGYGHLVNAAGLHADRIAHLMGVGERYRILPFKGFYRKLTSSAAARFKASIYPVPDLGMPFLGLHITRTIHDEVLLGPTAIPALGRENYGFWEGMDLRELPRIMIDLAGMVLKNTDGFARMVQDELSKYLDVGFLKAVRRLAPALGPEDIVPSDKVGIRAQLVDHVARKLVMDLVVESGPDSTHVLNAISPAFTSAFSFAEVLADRVA